MADDQSNQLQGDNTQKDPEQWTTGGEPATGAQMSYLHTMADQANEQVPESLTKSEASELIEKLQAKTGRSGEAASNS